MSEAMFPNGAVLLVGGSGGIGRAIAREFAAAGSPVAVTYRSRAAEAEELAAQIAGEGGRAAAYQLDVTDPASVHAAANGAARDFDRLHSVVFAAGRFPEQMFISEYTSEQYRDALAVETVGFFNVVQATLPHFRAMGGGSYVNLGSAGGIAWAKKDGLSIIPKASNDALVKGIAVEEGRHGIRANTVQVGVIAAGMFLEFEKQGVFDDSWKQRSLNRLAIKRWGQPEEIGHAAVFLASRRAAYITGQSLSVTGGFGL